MPVIRTYKCNDCGDLFEVMLDSGNDGDPDCPYCARVMEWRPGMFSVKTNKSRALDITQSIIEEDYGLTDLKDSLREGDIAAKEPAPRSRDERDAIERVKHEAEQAMKDATKLSPEAQRFWNAGGQMGNLNVKSVIQNAKGTVPADRNPMNIISKGGKNGMLPVNYRLLTETGRMITIRK